MRYPSSKQDRGCKIRGLCRSKMQRLRIQEIIMRRLFVGWFVLLPALALGQQGKSPIADVLRQMLNGREKNTVAAFEAMPADKFNYKPTPEQMTFGHLAAHIAEGNYYFCSNAGDVPQP